MGDFELHIIGVGRMENDFEGLGADQRHSFDFGFWNILWALGRFERVGQQFQAGGLSCYRQPV
jgi:hypothetical protein